MEIGRRLRPLRDDGILIIGSGFMGAGIAGKIFSPSKPAPYLSDAMLGFLHPLRGESGKVEFAPALAIESVTRSGRRGRWSLAELLPHPFTPAALTHS